ncbi:MAG TPA: hemerythrin domain-containing protein [Nocardioides sp.]
MRSTVSMDVVDLITRDHREVDRIFDELRNDPGSRPVLVPVLEMLLTAHSRAEEAAVYPAAAKEAGEVGEVAHRHREHLLADQLVALLADTDPEAAEFDDVLDELVDTVTHHVNEEEFKLLPSMKARLGDDRRAELGRAFLDSRSEHLGLPVRESAEQ